MDKLIYNGNTYTTDSDAVDHILMSVSAYVGDSLPVVQLAADTLTAVVRDYTLEVDLLSADGLLLAAADSVLMADRLADTGLDRYLYGSEILYYHNDVLLGRFRLSAITRTGRYEYRLDCISDVGLLISSNHYGGVYAGVTMAALVKEIVGGIVPYTLDTTLGSTPLYGWLPKASRRDNLLRVLFAVGGRVLKTTAGQINIVPYAASTPYTIPVDSFYLGGSVTGGTPASEINVIEHAYLALPSDELVTLFDGESAAESLLTPKGVRVNGVLVEFDEPVHDLTVDNAELLESDANYAVLGQSPQAVLKGRKYSHTQRRITRRTETGATPNVITSSACGLVNQLNSELVADRLQAYYSSAKTVSADIVVTTQKAGDAVTFVDPFGDETTGYIGSLELAMSGIVKASAELIAGFIPSASGNYYTHVVVIQSNGTWTVPAECKGKIRAVLFGGGQGGARGQSGEDGARGSSSGYGKSGKGGEPGAPGAGGKIYTITLAVAVGQTFSAKIGLGGQGETASSARTDGGATTFGPYSSANGYVSDVGYQDLINGTLYGTPGDTGTPGGDGQAPDGGRPTVSYNGSTWTAGETGATGTLSGTTAQGGLGGGAAVGADGSNGGDGEVDRNPDGSRYATGGPGGNGADAIKPANATVPGGGGHGGHGGGGGGGGGGAKDWGGSGGSGGLGSAGSDGAAGLILIYY